MTEGLNIVLVAVIGVFVILLVLIALITLGGRLLEGLGRDSDGDRETP